MIFRKYNSIQNGNLYNEKLPKLILNLTIMIFIWFQDDLLFIRDDSSIRFIRV